MFQFHKGSINTLYLHSLLFFIGGFNSIKVRLIRRFQFYFVRNFHGFNSIKVRLILTNSAKMSISDFSFNSIKVRLIQRKSLEMRM